MKVEKWAADFVNDPNQDYKLICEILYEEKDAGVIRKENDGLVIEWFKSDKGLSVPLDWFAGLLQEAKERL